VIGLVVVSHSARLAAGVAELAGQMAPSVAIVPCGGDGAGGLGTDYAAVVGALAAADSGDGVVVLFDLGSARMVADMAAEEAGGPVLVVDAPLVEGAVAAAVRAQGGAGLEEVAAAAADAVSAFAPVGPAGGAGPSGDPVEPAAEAGSSTDPADPAGFADPTDPARGPGPSGDPVAASAALGVAPVVPADVPSDVRTDAPSDVPPSGAPEAPAAPAAPAGEPVRAEVRLLNEVGLHARPAALVVRALAALDASVTIGFASAAADARSVLDLMGLGAPGGARIQVVASGPDAEEAVRRVRELAERRFDE
jgi:PTS hybrid protein